MANSEFSKFNLDERLIKKLTDRRITIPTKIQDDVIPKVLKGNDVIGQSMTGTGKTLSYLIPILHEHIKNNDEKTLILAPTKELAVQIYEETMYYCENTDIKPELLIPGKEIEKQETNIKNNQNLVIAVPGRIVKLIENGSYKVSGIKKIVLDEADFLIDLGFMKDLETIFGIAKSLKQIMVFTATLSAKTKEVIDLAHNQKKASRIDPKNTLPEKIKNIFIPINDDQYRDSTLMGILDIINPFLSIIFVRTKDESEKLYKMLKEKKMNIGLLNGNMLSGQRKKIINDFREAKIQYLVATDLASRGLDIDGITHIINYTQPYNESDYIHRAGRTGRMNEDGLVISICNELDEGYLKKYLININSPLTAYKITKNGLEEFKGYKGVRPRFNLNEIKKKEKLTEKKASEKKGEDNGQKKRRNSSKR